MIPKEPSKTYCPRPFMSSSLQAFDTALPCCQFQNMKPFTKRHVPIYETRNGEFMTDMRARMLRGDRVDGCETCYEEEDIGITSMRQHQLTTIGYKTRLSLTKLELFLDNVCNIKCRSCSSVHSHLIWNDEQKLYGITLSPTKYLENHIYKDLDLSELDDVELLGGEPTISSNLERFFRKVDQQNRLDKIKINLHTNGMVPPKDTLLKALTDCRYLDLSISVDAYGKLNDYVRGSSNFTAISQQMEFYKQLADQRPAGTTKIQVHSAVSIYTINHVDELTAFVSHNFPSFIKTFQMVQGPNWMSVRNTPDDYKNLVCSKIKDPEMLAYLNSPGENLFHHFINFTQGLDDIRNESLALLNPTLYEYILNYKDKVSPEVSKEFFLKTIAGWKGETSL
jgi:pyruvate-formate lyase-activating enzyme